MPRKTDQWVQPENSVKLAALWVCPRMCAQMRLGDAVACRWSPELEANPASDKWLRRATSSQDVNMASMHDSAVQKKPSEPPCSSGTANGSVVHRGEPELVFDANPCYNLQVNEVDSDPRAELGGVYVQECLCSRPTAIAKVTSNF